MKRIFYLIVTSLFAAVSCSYLDITPELGLTEEDVFSTYTNYMSYLESAYTGDPLGSGTGGGTQDPYPFNLMYGSYPMVMNAIMGCSLIFAEHRTVMSLQPSFVSVIFTSPFLIPQTPFYGD